MKLVAQSAPYIRKPVSVKRMMLDVLLALMPVVLFACIQNGWSGIYVFFNFNGNNAYSRMALSYVY